MKKWLRRLRGALGLGAVWGAAGAIVGGLGGAITGVLTSNVYQFVSFFAVNAGVLGFLLGSGFAVVLTLQDERHALGELSSGRAGLLGATAGALLPLGWLVAPVGAVLRNFMALPTGELALVFVGAVAVCTGLGAAIGAGTMALAARAPAALPAAGDIDRTAIASSRDML